MSDTAYTTALTTVARVKARLGITDTGFDEVFKSYVNAVTDFIEKYCDRKFGSRTYTNEKYSVDQEGQRRLLLRNFPVTALSTLEYKAGTPSVPAYTAFGADDYELEEDGRNGSIYMHFVPPTGPNMLRATYTAGYAIDFTKYGATGHDLPADITEVAERLIVKRFKKRDAEGKTIEAGMQGASMTWGEFLEQDDKDLLDRYKRFVFA